VRQNGRYLEERRRVRRDAEADGRNGVSIKSGIGRHWPFCSLLLAGLVLRVAAQVAYQPALLYIDSKKYLFGTQVPSWGAFDPLGYTLLVLRPMLLVTSLATVALLQHALAIAIAVATYVLMLRLGVNRWLAALTTAPVLLDAYQLVAEQTIMPDTLFEVLVVAGLLILLWRPKPGLTVVIAAGLILGLSAPVRQVGEALIVPALIYVLAAGGSWRRRLLHGTVLTACFVLPVIGYMSYSEFSLHDGFELSNMGDEYLYGRMAHAADCATLKLPADEWSLCPRASAAAMLGVDGLVNIGLAHDQTYAGSGPQPPTGLPLGVLQLRFVHAVSEQQPLRVLGDISHDAVKIFALTRDGLPGDTPIARWQFQDGYPYYPPGITAAGATSANEIFALSGGGSTQVNKPLASALRSYQLNGGYTPGPVFLICLLAGLGGIVAYRRLGESRLALACLLLTGSGIVLLLGADLYEFSWRYQLPALITWPAAGVLGGTALARLYHQRRNATATAYAEMDLPAEEAICE
jgi:hypothetical protein